MYLLITEHFDPWVGRIPWRRKWKPTPVFLPGKFHGQRSLVGYSPWDTPDNAEVGCHALLQRIFLTRVSCSSCIVQFSSVAHSCLTPCSPMNCSTPGLPVHHQLPEFTQTHVHQVGDVIQPSYPLSSPSPPALNLSQHQGLFQ